MLVIWLLAATTGPRAYAAVPGAIGAWIGQIMLFGCTFAFFLHLCGGIRHLVWDTVYGLELRSIYACGGERGAHRGRLGRRLAYGGVEPWTVNTCARPWLALSGACRLKRGPNTGGRSAFSSCPPPADTVVRRLNDRTYRQDSVTFIA